MTSFNKFKQATTKEDFKPGELPYKRQMINILIDRDVVRRSKRRGKYVLKKKLHAKDIYKFIDAARVKSLSYNFNFLSNQGFEIRQQ